MQRVLLVEDNPSDILTVKFLLKSTGCSIDIAQNSLDAYEKARSVRYDLVLLDWFLPQFSGIEFLKTVRKDPSLKTLPIIMLSGRNELKDIKAAIFEGVNDYIVKPIDPMIFKTKTDAVLNSKAKLTWKLVDVLRSKFQTAGVVSEKAILLAVSEVEIKVGLSTKLNIGSTYSFSFDLLRELEISELSVRIVDDVSDGNQEGRCHYIGRIVGLPEKDLAKIRIICRTIQLEEGQHTSNEARTES